MAEYLTVKDVAAMMQVSSNTVWKWVKLGRLHPLRIGTSHFRFEKARLIRDLETYEYDGSETASDPTMG